MWLCSRNNLQKEGRRVRGMGRRADLGRLSCLSLLRARRSKFERNINHRYRAIKSRGYRNVRCQCVCFDIKTHKTHFNIGGRRAENAWAGKARGSCVVLVCMCIAPDDGRTAGGQQQQSSERIRVHFSKRKSAAPCARVNVHRSSQFAPQSQR
jgi:hypothetical protein